MAGKGYNYADDFDDDWYADEDEYYEEDDAEDPELAAAVQAAKKASLAGKPARVSVRHSYDDADQLSDIAAVSRTTADGMAAVSGANTLKLSLMALQAAQSAGKTSQASTAPAGKDASKAPAKPAALQGNGSSSCRAAGAAGGSALASYLCAPAEAHHRAGASQQVSQPSGAIRHRHAEEVRCGGIVPVRLTRLPADASLQACMIGL